MLLVNDEQQSRIARAAFQAMATATEQRYGVGSTKH
jgi:hypothetical protein